VNSIKCGLVLLIASLIACSDSSSSGDDLADAVDVPGDINVDFSLSDSPSDPDIETTTDAINPDQNLSDVRDSSVDQACNPTLDLACPCTEPQGVEEISPGVFQDQLVCDARTFSTPLEVSDSLQVTIEFDSEVGHLDLRLFDRNGSTVVDQSTTDTDVQSVSFSDAVEAGTYYFMVSARTAADRNFFDLTVEVTDQL